MKHIRSCPQIKELMTTLRRIRDENDKFSPYEDADKLT